MLPEVLTQWKNLKTLVKIESERILNDEKQIQTRYYISKENKYRARTGFSAENLSTLRKLALQIIKSQTALKNEELKQGTQQIISKN